MLSETTSTFGVRAFVQEDITQVADLWWKFLRHCKRPSPVAVQSYFYDLYFSDHPCIDSALPSLVYEGNDR